MEISIIAVGGGHRFAPKDLLYQEAVLLGRWLASRGYAIRSGGYGGLMEAVSKGAAIAGGKVLGVGLANWSFEQKNEFVDTDDYLQSISITQRVQDIFWDSNVNIFLGGGVGTLAEFFAVWTGKIMRFIPAEVPLILVGKEWNLFLDSLSEHYQVFQEHKQHLIVFPSVEVLIEQWSRGEIGHQAIPVPDQEKWNCAAADWDRAIKDPGHFANLEDGYGRFDRFLSATLENRVWSENSLSILDLGCGTGEATMSLKKTIPAASLWSIDGLDFSETMIKSSSEKHLFKKLFPIPAEDIAKIPENYHVIFSRGILLSRFGGQQLKTMLRAIHSKLLDQGVLIFDFLNHILDDSLQPAGKTRLLFSELRSLLQECGYRVTDVEGLGCRSLNLACVKQPLGSMQVKLITSNPDKYKVFDSLLKRYGIDLATWKGEIKEIQSQDLEVVSKTKARQLYEQLHTALMVDDVALSLDAYPNFPGTMTKQVLQTVKLSGLQRLLTDKTHAATLRCVVTVWLDEGRFAQFCGSIRGVLNFASTKDASLPLNSVFIPEGEKETLGELELRKPSFLTHRMQAVTAACEWLQKLKK